MRRILLSLTAVSLLGSWNTVKIQAAIAIWTFGTPVGFSSISIPADCSSGVQSAVFTSRVQPGIAIGNTTGSSGAGTGMQMVRDGQDRTEAVEPFHLGAKKATSPS